VSAAEHAVALLLSAARNVPQAMASLKSGQWKRSAFTGVELHDKVAGILGLGKIGVLVAQRLAAFGMTVIAYDPYVAVARAAQLGVRLVSLDELLAESDFISVHLPKNSETTGLIGGRQLRVVKPGVRIINAARGGIVDENALASALADGRVAGAALDVYATEPCTDSPLFGLPNVVVTPHLGASTHEAQEKAGTQVARSVRLALAGEFVPDAVNVQGGTVDEMIRPGLPLAEKLGRIFTAVAGGIAARIDVEVRGEIAGLDVSVLQLAALKGVFSDIVEDAVTYVNAPLLAADRGVEVSLSTDKQSPDWRNVVTLRGTRPDGQVVSVGGTLTGQRQLEKLVEVNGFDMEIAPAEHMVFFTYSDRPGVVGIVGQILGTQGINIAGMQVCRDARGGHALIVLTVDSALPPGVLEEITSSIGAVFGRAVDLDGR
jgi:D-3-phosphoglycerate dehydrogenase